MGHSRLGTLPDSRPWGRVVEHIAGGASAAVVAAATTSAAAAGLTRGKTDPGVAHVVRLLALLVRAARGDGFAAALAEHDLTVPAEPTLFDLTAGFAAAVQSWHAAHPGCRTDLGEMAALAAAEALAHCVGDRAAGLFATGDEVRAAVRELSTANGFAALGHAFFARFLRRFLLYHLGRELSQHVGGSGRFADPAQHAAFVTELEVHCSEAAVIVREFAGGWLNATRGNRNPTARRTAEFVAYALDKLRRELLRRGVARG